MATRSNNLRQKPEFWRGRTGERIVADLLRERGWYVIPSYDYSGEEGNKAPKLEGLSESFVIPDLDISRKGQRRWAEVKTKAAATYTRVTKRFEHGIPKRHVDSYLKVQEITGCEVWLFVYEESTGDILCGKIDDLLCQRREYDGQKMSRGGMVFFPRSAFRLYAKVAAGSQHNEGDTRHSKRGG